MHISQTVPYFMAKSGSLSSFLEIELPVRMPPACGNACSRWLEISIVLGPTTENHLSCNPTQYVHLIAKWQTKYVLLLHCRGDSEWIFLYSGTLYFSNAGQANESSGMQDQMARISSPNKKWLHQNGLELRCKQSLYYPESTETYSFLTIAGLLDPLGI